MSENIDYFFITRYVINSIFIIYNIMCVAYVWMKYVISILKTIQLQINYTD